MPLYDYGCSTCGPFREWRSMSEWEARVPCPSCSVPAPRLAAAPMLAVLSSNNRIAHEHNERSAHEPKVVRREDLPQDHSHQHRVSPLIKKQLAMFTEAHLIGRGWWATRKIVVGDG
jgi:putative FmdB family regulatory protein